MVLTSVFWNKACSNGKSLLSLPVFRRGRRAVLERVYLISEEPKGVLARTQGSFGLSSFVETVYGESQFDRS